jgi:N-acetylmuramoyl-L-alanine amidase
MSIICLFLLLFTLQLNAQMPRTFSIIIDPAGDAQTTGRKLNDSFERGLTLQCAEQLQELLENKYPYVRVVLTRFPGETVHALQNANFANRLDAQLYLSIHFYQTTEKLPTLFIYHLCYDTNTLIPTKKTDLAFIPYDQAHLESSTTTKAYARTIQEHFKQPQYRTTFLVHGIIGLPFKPLAGIKAPALALEIGLSNKDDWNDYCKAIADSLAPIIEA